MLAGINNTCVTFQSNYPQSYSSHGYQDYVSSGPPPPPGNFYGQGGQPAYPGSAYNNYSPYGMYKIGKFMYDACTFFSAYAQVHHSLRCPRLYDMSWYPLGLACTYIMSCGLSEPLPFVCLFALMLYVAVNSYGHVGTVSSPNHTFFLSNPLICIQTFYRLRAFATNSV